MHLLKITWLSILLVMIIQIVIFIRADFVRAQFYFPVTTGILDFYNFGTMRYGSLFGLSGTIPTFLSGAGLIGSAYPFEPFYSGGVFGGFYGITWPFGVYPWPYFLNF
ncbi:hypothetical protein JXL19_09900 [bacterium]|nr:hypothetical protein [bacterium]